MQLCETILLNSNLPDFACAALSILRSHMSFLWMKIFSLEQDRLKLLKQLDAFSKSMRYPLNRWNNTFENYFNCCTKYMSSFSEYLSKYYRKHTLVDFGDCRGRRFYSSSAFWWQEFNMCVVQPLQCFMLSVSWPLLRRWLTSKESSLSFNILT